MIVKSSPRPPSRLAKFIALSAALVFFLGAEAVCRLAAGPNHLDEILKLLQRDPVLFWRVRPNLRTRFAGVPVWTDGRGLRVRPVEGAAPKAGYRVLCLGASPTFGWGVNYEETYAAVAETSLRQAGLSVEVINGGQIGFSSYQGKWLLRRELADLQPRVVTIAYVINDIDTYRFFRSDGRPDAVLPPENEALTAVADLLDRSSFYRWFSGFIRAGADRRKIHAGQPVQVYRPASRRVPPDDYRANLAEMVDFARARHLTPILIAMPVHLPSGEPAPEEARQQASELFHRAMRDQTKEHCPTVISILQQAVALDPDFSAAYYEIGYCQERLGRPAASAEAFAALMKSEARRCGRDGRAYNRLMREVAAEKNVVLIDAAAVFSQRGDEDLFLTAQGDPIHPSAAGHRLLGELLAGVLQADSAAREAR